MGNINAELNIMPYVPKSNDTALLCLVAPIDYVEYTKYTLGNKHRVSLFGDISVNSVNLDFLKKLRFLYFDETIEFHMTD